MVATLGRISFSVAMKIMLFNFVFLLGLHGVVEGVKLDKLNAQVTLQCVDPDPEKWFSPFGELIVSDNKKYVIEKDNLTIHRVGENDLGKYFCEVGGKNETVEVHCPAMIKPLEKSVNVVQGEEIKVHCHAIGYPAPEYTWYRIEDDVNVNITFGPELYINESKKEHYGVYMCMAVNEHGNSSSITKIRVKDKLAPLWPFIGIVIEVIILVVIIIIYEKRKSKQDADDIGKDPTLKAADNNSSNVRQRK